MCMEVSECSFLQLRLYYASFALKLNSIPSNEIQKKIHKKNEIAIKKKELALKNPPGPKPSSMYACIPYLVKCM